MKEEVPKELLELIIFEEEDINNFKKYSQVRSKEIYYNIAKYLSKNFSAKKIEYKIVNDYLKLDKDIKDILYRFLSTFEEQTKQKLLTNFIIKNKKIIRAVEDIKFPNKDMWEILNFEQKWLDFIGVPEKKFINLFTYICNFKLKGFNTKDIRKINSLRNSVMHHALLLFSPNSKEIVNKIVKLKENLLEPWDIFLKEELIKSLLKRNYASTLLSKEKWVNLIWNM